MRADVVGFSRCESVFFADKRTDKQIPCELYVKYIAGNKKKAFIDSSVVPSHWCDKSESFLQQPVMKMTCGELKKLGLRDYTTIRKRDFDGML